MSKFIVRYTAAADAALLNKAEGEVTYLARRNAGSVRTANIKEARIMDRTTAHDAAGRFNGVMQGLDGVTAEAVELPREVDAHSRYMRSDPRHPDYAPIKRLPTARERLLQQELAREPVTLGERLIPGCTCGRGAEWCRCD